MLTLAAQAGMAVPQIRRAGKPGPYKVGPTGFLVGPRSQVQTSTVEIDRVDEVLFESSSSGRHQSVKSWEAGAKPPFASH
jgi:hypothetical protein